MPSSDETNGSHTPDSRIVSPETPGSSAADLPYSSDYTYGSTQAGVSTPPTPHRTPALPAAGATTHGPIQPSPSGRGGGPALPPPPSDPPDDDEEESMLRMSFLDHLEELRRRIFYALGGFIVAFLLSLTFCKELWAIVSAPAVDALKTLGVHPPNLSQITPMEAFNVIWVKVPVLCSIFLASPWLLYQVWAFVAPGLYKRERRWAVPFVVSTAGLFITGGVFAYFVAFRYGLTFLLGIGRDVNVTPLVSINEYFDLFVNVTLGIGLVFELPVLIFFLTLLRLVTPKFLLAHSRYAILAIVVIAAVVTPTPDIFNLLLFATPMILLFYVGLFASYILILNREGKHFPWKRFLMIAGPVALALGLLGWYLFVKFHYYFLPRWPFLSR